MDAYIRITGDLANRACDKAWELLDGQLSDKVLSDGSRLVRVPMMHKSKFLNFLVTRYPSVKVVSEHY